MNDRKDEFLIVRVPVALKERLQKQAAKKGIKLSRLVRDILNAKG